MSFLEKNKEGAGSGVGSIFYSPGYIEKVFLIWYKSGKVPVARLAAMIPPQEGVGNRPHENTLRKWIDDYFVEKANALDEEVFKQISGQMVAEQIEMLRRHASTARKMQDVGARYLDDHEDEITSHAAIRLLVEGIRIERGASGIPEALEKMTQMTDEDLLGEIQDIIGNAQVEILPLEDGN